MRILVIKRKNIYIGLAILLLIIIGIILLLTMTRDKTVSNYQLRYTYQSLLPEEAQNLIESSSNIVILDVRNKKDYEQGHLVNALVIPLKELKDRLSELDTDTVYLVYCEKGKDSLKASKILAESGFPRVFNLVGGYKKWPYGIEKIK